tara:strand:- start:195 stop:863 length:669 start_codon:yes stop_codon:yes gene_type:complete
MKISGETLSVLKNFASINTNMVFKPGSTISTMSSAKNIVAMATISEEIPNNFAIYDLNSLLALLTLMNDQEVSFGDNSLIITSSAGTFEYFYSNPELVVGGVKEIETHVVYEFKLTAEDIQTLMKAAAITSAPTISFTCKDSEVNIIVSDRKNESSNTFKKPIGTSFEPFDVFIAVENLKVIPEAYTVSVAKGPNEKGRFIRLDNESKDLKYWIAAEPGSVA